MHASRREALAQRLEPSAIVARLPDPGLIAAVAGVAIVILGVAGAFVGAYKAQGEGPIADRLFSLINEKTVPAFFSGALLAAGGLFAVLAARCRLHGAHFIWLAFGALLLLMSLDEVIEIHERIETWTGVDWQQPYAVVAVGAAVVWWRILLRLDRLPRAMMIGGAVAWAVSFGLEDAEYDSMDQPVAGFAVMAISEEVLEMVGSTLFLLALVVALKETRARRP